MPSKNSFLTNTVSEVIRFLDGLKISLRDIDAIFPFKEVVGDKKLVEYW